MRMLEEAAPLRSRKGRPGRGGELASIARLRRECRRFREEVVCIRSFPRLRLRWPSLARLEIGNESSEEDDAVWDTADAQPCNPLFPCRQYVGIGQDGDVEPASNVLAPGDAGNKSYDHGSQLREGIDERSRRSSNDVEANKESIEAPGISEGRGIFGSITVCQKPRCDDSVLEYEKTFDRSMESERPSQLLDSMSASKDATQFSHDANFMESESAKHSPKDPTLSNVHTNAGARRAATTLFTANPHYNYYEISAERSPPSSLRCQSEAFELVDFPGSNVSGNANHNEWELRSSPVVCSSFESLTSSVSEHTGHATANKKNQVYAHVDTDLPTDPCKPLLSCVSGAPPKCSLDVGRACEKAGIERELNGLPVSTRCVQVSHVEAEACQSRIVDNVKRDKFLHSMSYSELNKRKPSSPAGSSVRMEKSLLSIQNQHQNSASNEEKQEQQVDLIEDCAERKLSTSLSSSKLREASIVPNSRTTQDDSHAIVSSDREAFSGPAETHISWSELIALSGMENLARLGFGSTRDSAMAALMSMRIKLALEKLEKVRDEEHLCGKSRTKRRMMDNRHPSVSWKDPLHVDEVPSKGPVDSSELKIPFTQDDLCKNSDTSYLESHFFSKKDNTIKTLDGDHRRSNDRSQKCSSNARFSAQSPAAEEPDLYLQQVISALESGHEFEEEESSTASMAGPGENEDPTKPLREALVTRNSRPSHAEEMCKSHEDAVGAIDRRIPRCLDVAKPDVLIEESKSGKDETGFHNSNITRHLNYQGPMPNANCEDQPAFSVQINVPSGSSVAVVTGDHEYVRDKLAVDKRQGGRNRSEDLSPSVFLPGNNVPLDHTMSTSPRQRRLPAPLRTHSQNKTSLTVHGSCPSSPSSLSRVHTLDPTERSPTEKTQSIPPSAFKGRLSPGGRSPKTVRFNTREDLHRFDKKIASLVKKATRLEEETMFPRNFPPKAKVSGHQERAPEEEQERGQRPFVSKSTQAKSQEFGLPDCSKHPESHASQTAEKLQAFGSAAAELASELNMLMKDKRHEVKLDSQSRNKRKVVWASPVAEELTSGHTSMKQPIKSETLELVRPLQSMQSSTAGSNTPIPYNVTSPAVQAVHNVGRPKGREKMLPPQQCRTMKRTQFQQRNASPESESVAVPPARGRANFGRNGVSQATSCNLGHCRTVDEEGVANARKYLNTSNGGVFNCHEFRQELKELQMERRKLETLVSTIVSTDISPGIWQGKQSAKDASGELQKTSLSSRIAVEGDPSMGGSAKRQKNASSGRDRLTRSNISKLGLSGKRSFPPQQRLHCLEADNGDMGNGMPIKHSAGQLRAITRRQGLTGVDSMQNVMDCRDMTAEELGYHDVIGQEVLARKLTCTDRQENPKSEFIVRHPKEQTTQTSPQSLDINLHQQAMYCKSNPSQEYMNPLSSSSGTHIFQHIATEGEECQNIISKDTHFETHATEKSTLNVPHAVPVCPSDEFFAAEESTVAVSILQRQPVPTHSEALMQPLESSFPLLQPSVSQSPIKESSGLKVPEVTESVARENLTARESEQIFCDAEIFGKTASNSNLSALVKTGVPRRHDLRDSAPVDLQISTSLQLSLVQAGQQQTTEEATPPPQNLETITYPIKHGTAGKEDLKDGISDYQKTTPEPAQKSFSSDRSEEHRTRAAISDTSTSWTGSLQSVLAAYEAAKVNAARVLTPVVDVPILKARPPVSYAHDHGNGPVPPADKKNLKTHRPPAAQEKLLPLTLLEEAERNETKELRLRRARKDSRRNQQKLLMGREQSDRMEKGLRNETKKWQQFKVPKFIYRTAEFGLKRREEWNDSTATSQDIQKTNRKAAAKDASESVIKKNLRHELKRKQRQKHIVKNLQPLKARECGTRRKDGDHHAVVTYANALSLTKAEKGPARVKQITPPVEDRGKRRENQHLGDQVGTKGHKAFVTPVSKTGNEGNVKLKIENRVLDEFTEAFGSERPISAANFVNEDVRNSVEQWLNTSGGFEYLEAFDDTGEERLFDGQGLKSILPRETNLVESPARDASKDFERSDPSSFVDVGRVRLLETVALRTSVKALSADQVDSSSSARHALQCSPYPHRGPPDEVGLSNKEAENFPVAERASQQTLECSILNCGNKHSSELLDLGVSNRQDEKGVLGKGVNTESVTLDGTRADKDDVAALAEDDELELALLEIVLQTILKDDPEISEKMTRGTSPEPKTGPPDEQSRPMVTIQSAAVSREQELSVQTGDNKASVEQILERLACNAAATESASDLHASGSAKSSDGEWPEYKCLADLQSPSSSVDGKMRPMNNSLQEQEGRFRSDQGEQIDDEAPSEKMSTPSTSEPETNQKHSVERVPSRTGPGGTRPPYSAIHSVRAAERQPIDFPGIASLAFGYPSPRPPPLKPAGQTDIDTSSVSVQTVDLSAPQPPHPGPSVVVPYYGLMDAIMPSYAMYAPPYPAFEGPSQANAVPLVSQGQHGLQFVPFHYGLTPRGMIPMFCPPFMMAPPRPAHEGPSQPPVMPVTPTVQYAPQAPAPSTGLEQTTARTSQPSPSSLTPAADIAVRLAPKSDNIVSRPRSRHRGSSSSLDSQCSSPTTPSTCPSSPEHEATVAAALLARVSHKAGSFLFQEGSSDEAELYKENQGCPRKQDQETQIGGNEILLPQSLARATDVEDHPVQPIIKHDNHYLPRVEIASGRPSLHTHATISSTAGTKLRSGTSISVDSGRSTELIVSYDGSGSSEGSLKHAPGMPRGRWADPQTTLWSSGTFMGTAGKLQFFHGPGGNRAHSASYGFTRTLPLSEGEYEPGQLPSEGECMHLFRNFWEPHRSSQWVGLLDGQDDVSEPGEIGQYALTRLLQTSRSNGGQVSYKQDLSEGELKAGTLTEPGEVKP